MPAAGAILSRIWPHLLWLAVIAGIYFWYDHQITVSYNKGAADQSIADRDEFRNAETIATNRQNTMVSANAKQSSKTAKDSDNGLKKNYIELSGRYDALRLRWEKHRADTSSSRDNSPANGIPGGGPGNADAYCATQGWVDFDTASAAAEAADRAIAKDDTWIGWYNKNKSNWPVDMAPFDLLKDNDITIPAIDK